jgi:uncharacterized protein
VTAPSLEAASLSVHQLSGRFAVCRLPREADAALPRSGPLRSLTVTDEEISLICAEGEAPAGAQVEPGWCALRVAGTFDFGVVGLLARLAGALAAAGVPILAIATFDTDYLLVKAADLERAAAALRDAGVCVELSR